MSEVPGCVKVGDLREYARIGQYGSTDR